MVSLFSFWDFHVSWHSWCCCPDHFGINFSDISERFRTVNLISQSIFLGKFHGSRDFWTLANVIAVILDDITKISRNVKPRLGGDRFAWFVDVLGKIFRCSCFSLFVRNASMVYCLRLYKLFRHGNQKLLASLTAGEQRTAFQMACKNLTNEHAS